MSNLSNVSSETLDELFVADANFTTIKLVSEHGGQPGVNGSVRHSQLLDYLARKFSSRTSTADDNLTVIVLYSLIVLISLFGNCLVCYVILKNKSVRTKTNILMANITVSGLMITIFNIPFNIARLLLNNWPFGQILCKLLPAIQVTSV